MSRLKYFTRLIAPLETAYSTTERNKDYFDSQTGKAGYLDNTIAAQQQQIDIFTKILVGGELEVSDYFKCTSVYYFLRNRMPITQLKKRKKNCLFPNNLHQASFLTYKNLASLSYKPRNDLLEFVEITILKKVASCIIKVKSTLTVKDARNLSLYRQG